METKVNKKEEEEGTTLKDPERVDNTQKVLKSSAKELTSIRPREIMWMRCNYLGEECRCGLRVQVGERDSAWESCLGVDARASERGTESTISWTASVPSKFPNHGTS